MCRCGRHTARDVAQYWRRSQQIVDDDATICKQLRQCNHTHTTRLSRRRRGKPKPYIERLRRDMRNISHQQYRPIVHRARTSVHPFFLAKLDCSALLLL